MLHFVMWRDGEYDLGPLKSHFKIQTNHEFCFQTGPMLSAF